MIGDPRLTPSGDILTSLDWTDRMASWHAGAENNCDEREGWAGSSRPAFLQAFERGDASAVAQAETMLDRVALALPDSEGGRDLLPDVFGARLSVGAHLAGSPVPFRRARRTERGPVEIALSVNSHAWTPTETIRARGVALLAVVLAMQRERPVSLLLHCTNAFEQDDNRHATTIVRMGTTPIDLSELAVALWHPGTSRRWLFQVQRMAAHSLKAPLSESLPQQRRPLEEIVGRPIWSIPTITPNNFDALSTPEKALAWTLAELQKSRARCDAMLAREAS